MKGLWLKLLVKGMLNSQMIHHKMEGSDIYRSMEFTTHSNLTKSVLPLIAALSIEEGQSTKSYWLVQI